MGKTGRTSSWFTSVVKRAFKSPTKPVRGDEQKNTCATRRREEEEEQEQQEEDKKRGKRIRQVFKKNQDSVSDKTHEVCKTRTITTVAKIELEAEETDDNFEVAAGPTTAAAPQLAAVEVVQDQEEHHYHYYYSSAAIVIQTAFRGYLARRALKALKGIVKLQAMVRGHNVRKRAEMTLHCIQALLRVQTRVLHQRRSTNSSSEECNNITPETVDSKRENALASAFSRQIWKDGGECRKNQREKIIQGGRFSCEPDQRYSDPVIKTVHIDTSQPYSYDPHPLHVDQSATHCDNYTSTPSPCRARNPHVWSTSPRFQTVNTNSPKPNYMAATASALARFRSQSAPKQRPISTGMAQEGKTRSAKKRLSFPVAEVRSS